jgi:hypothetical protein
MLVILLYGTGTTGGGGTILTVKVLVVVAPMLSVAFTET